MRSALVRGLRHLHALGTVMVIALAGVLLATTAGAQPSDPTARLHALRARADYLAQRQEFSRLIALIDEVVGLDQPGQLTASREAGRDLVAIASASMPSRAYPKLEHLFKRGIEVLRASPDARLGDFMVALNNLSVLYGQVGATELESEVNASIVDTAEKLEQHPDDDTASVFLSLGSTYFTARQYKPAAILYRPLHDYFLVRYGNKPDLLVAWLAKYARALQEDGQFENAVALFGNAFELLQGSTDAERLSIVALLDGIGRYASRDRNFSAAERAFAQARNLLERSGLGDTKHAAAVLHNLAAAHVREGKREKYPQAVAFLRRSLEIEAGNGNTSTTGYAQGLNQLAVVLDMAGETKQAERTYGQAIGVFEALAAKAPSEFVDCLIDFAAMLTRDRQHAEAAARLRQAITLLESMPVQSPQRTVNAFSSLAMADLSAGNVEDASRNFWRAITLRIANSSSAPGLE